jgi:hypothetical protein
MAMATGGGEPWEWGAAGVGCCSRGQGRPESGTQGGSNERNGELPRPDWFAVPFGVAQKHRALHSVPGCESLASAADGTATAAVAPD